jgi:hypothetical protein
MMSSHGWSGGFATSDGWVRTSDAIDFGEEDLEVFATHACKLLRHTSSDSVGRWINAFERLHYMLGFHSNSFSGGGQDARGSYFAWYAAIGSFGLFGGGALPIRRAWDKANTLVEGSNVEWAYLRCDGTDRQGNPANTYNERLLPNEPVDPVRDRTFWTARGTC